MGAVLEYKDFYSSHNHMPGSDHRIRVTGTVVFRTDGWSARLERRQDNPGINPFMLDLDLALEGGNGGGSADVLTPVPVEWSEPNPETEYQEVSIRVVGGNDEPAPPHLKVDHPE